MSPKLQWNSIERFLVEGEARWSRLGILLDRAESEPARELGRAGMLELVRLYRATASDLNRVRSLTADPEILGRLNALAGRAYRYVYRGRGRGRGRSTGRAGSVRRFLTREIPAAFRARSAAVWLAAGTFCAGALLGFGAVLVRPATAADLIPAQFYSESPRDRVAEIEEKEERISGVEEAAMFGAQLYTHNLQVSFLALSLAALTLVVGLWVLWYNGVILGAVAASYVVAGEGTFFIAWVGPHGALELPAIVFAGATGLALGKALLLPGELTRAESVRRIFPDVWRMMVGVALILISAGLIEGSFSQFSAKTVPYGLKIGVAAVLFAALLFVLFGPRRSAEET